VTDLASSLSDAGLAFSVEDVARLERYAAEVARLNERVNLVARTDVDHVVERHVLHSSVLARRPFPAGAHVVDWGTGGGFPLVPLAILRPEASYVGVDAVEKKVLAVRSMMRSLGLVNAITWHGRAEAFTQPHTHSVSRATAPLETLWRWHARTAVPMPSGPAMAGPDEWPAGLVCLKGGDLSEEIAALHAAFDGLNVETIPVGLPGDYFAEKVVVMVRQTA